MEPVIKHAAPARACSVDAEQWGTRAVCRAAADPDGLFVDGAARNLAAKVMCAGCPVRTECLAYALDDRIRYGIWGGMTGKERRALLRRRPLVTSWRRLLEAARSEHERRNGIRTFSIGGWSEANY
ncbi:WhiB family transcriptional regulator [Streptomyces sp. NPDC005533]|uniref:WhiB family transcriptional regulator n=1 Tax=Streptomyces sp. NPDC005533 TaxID=3364723 RepID=UPI00368CBCD1